MFKGQLVSIHIALAQGVPMQTLAQVEAVFGRGLRGDRYFEGLGHWSSSPGAGRAVTLIEVETIEALSRENKICLVPGASRRNLVTRGVPLNHLVAEEFQVGEVRLRGIRLCESCHYLEGLTTAGVFAGLVHRGGLRAEIASGGMLREGDAIAL
jgi:MOSC domain-containing protein YiiM